MAEVKVIQDERDGSLWAEMPGGRMRSVTEEQANLIYKNPGMIENILGAAGEATTGLLANAANMMGMGGETEQQAATRANQQLQARGMISPISTMAGQAIPYGAGEAAGFAAAGPLGAAAVGGAMGAAGNPDNPLLGAAMGAAPGLIGRGAVAIRSRMADRVVGAMDDAVREAPKNGAYLPGLMKQDELAQYGVELTPGRAAMVNAPDSRAYAAAQDLMRQEDLTRGLPSALPAARRMQGMLDQSETAMTRATQRQLGLPENTLMTNKVLGDNLEVLGKQYDDITGRAGKVVLDDAVRADMAQALEAATDASRSVIEKKISTFESLAEKHGNAIPADIFRTEMSNLNRIIRKTTDYVKAGELEELQKALTEGLGNSLSAADRDLLHEVNRKYALSMTLNKPGVISGGKVESGPFMRNWRGSRPSRIMNAQNDPLTRVAETLNYVNSNQAVPGKTSLRQAGLGALDARTGGLATPALGLAGAGVGGYFLGQ